MVPRGRGAIGGLADAQDVVVEVLVVGVEVVGDGSVFAAHEAADRFAHGYDEAVEADHGTAHLEPVPLLGGIEWMFLEDAVAHFVVVVVECLDASK